MPTSKLTIKFLQKWVYVFCFHLELLLYNDKLNVWFFCENVEVSGKKSLEHKPWRGLKCLFRPKILICNLHMQLHVAAEFMSVYNDSSSFLHFQVHTTFQNKQKKGMNEVCWHLSHAHFHLNTSLPFWLSEEVITKKYQSLMKTDSSSIKKKKKRCMWLRSLYLKAELPVMVWIFLLAFLFFHWVDLKTRVWQSCLTD